jgi:hypothetical protein
VLRQPLLGGRFGRTSHHVAIDRHRGGDLGIGWA